jgi:hypothetical protein
MYALISGVLGKLGISFESLGYNAFEESLLRKRYHYSTGDLLSTLSRSLLYFCEAGALVYKTGDISAIYHSGGEYLQHYVTVGDLKFALQQVIDGTSKLEHTADLRDEAEREIVELDRMIENAKALGGSDCKPLIDLRQPLKHKLEDMIAVTSAASMRRAPLALRFLATQVVANLHLSFSCSD